MIPIYEQDGQCVVVGDPTEGALIVAASKAGLTQQALEQEMPRLDTIPFESDFQYMATLHSKPDQLIYVKGSTGYPQTVRSEAQYRGTPGTFGPHSGGAGQMQWQSRVTRVPLPKSQ